MCSIFGIGFLKGHTFFNKTFLKSALKTLATEAESRGRTASGFAFSTEREIAVIKKNVAASRLVNLPEFDEAFDKYVDPSKYGKPFSIVGHCRLKTKGTELDNVNNHPIIRDKIVGVHNGIISNDDAMFNKFESAMKRNGEVDSEIIFAMIDLFTETFDVKSSIRKTVKQLNGGLACAMLHKSHPHSLWLFKTRNPCTLVIYKKVGIIVWASAGEFISKAFVASQDMGEGEQIEFEPNEGIGINLIDKNLNRFDLPY